LIPFAGNFLPGMIQALPQYFTNTIPRENIGTQPYSVISYDSDSFETSLTAYTDLIDNKEIDIYFHKLNFGDE
jgi:CRISPR-associated protein Cas5, Tneap subtype